MTDLVDTNKETTFRDTEINLGEYLSVLASAKWSIAGITAACFLLSLFYVILAKPIYRSDAMIQIEQNSSSAGLSALQDITSLLGSQSSTETEIEIIQSRSVLGNTVDKLHLDIDVQPRYFPLIGSKIARHFQSKNPGVLQKPALGLSSYAWGGADLIVDRFDVPSDMLDHPFLLVANGGGGV